MIDAIIYIPSITTLLGWFAENRPEALNEDGTEIVGLDRTPAVANGDEVLVYCRLRDDKADEWRGTPGVEVLAEAPYQGKGTADAVYTALFADADATEKHDGVYSPEPIITDYGETIYPPKMFGVMA